MKYLVILCAHGATMAHPARGAWIEMQAARNGKPTSKSRTPQGVRGLKCAQAVAGRLGSLSHPARGAWIEIYLQVLYFVLDNVAPRKGCVD